MTQTAERHLTPEQEKARNLIDRYGHIAALVTWGVLAVGALYLAALYLLSR
jgi:type VI protein secretion system component VasF